MNKKTYQQPTMTVIRLRHRTRILDGSPKMAGQRHNYEKKTQSTWTDDEEY
jgi:hypothetical protein